MKGIIMAGGKATRLFPLTLATNKHLLPVYDKPMTYYAIESLVNAGINDVILITSREHAGGFLYHCSDGQKFGLTRLSYSLSERDYGIVEDLKRAESFVGNSKICLVMADNIFEYSLAPIIKEFEDYGEGAHIILAKVDNPTKFGVPIFKGKNIVRFEEKPENPASGYAVTGCYLYDSSFFHVVEETARLLGRSVEIPDINNMYISLGKLSHSVVSGGWWDAGGSIRDYNDVCRIIEKTGANKSLAY